MIWTLFEDEVYTKHDIRTMYLSNFKEDLLKLGFSQNTLIDREFPSTYDKWTSLEKRSFLQGCFSANGCVTTKYRVSYKSTSKKFIDKLQSTLLDDFGINSIITTNKSKKVKFSNGEYTCRESYDLNINRYDDIVEFGRQINFYHKYKQEMLSELINYRTPTVINVKPLGKEVVFDFHEPDTHWGVVKGCITHNCGEVPLMEGSSCLLSSINLSAYVLNPFSYQAKFDIDSLLEDIPYIVRFMDDLLEEGLPFLPLEYQRRSSIEKREIGIGVMGLADMLIKLRMIYGSSMANSQVGGIMYKMSNKILQSSALLAKERGVYPKYSDKVLDSKFLNHIATEDTMELIFEHGLRNAQLISIAPTGSISTMWGVSGGIEPIFALSHNRRSESLGDGEDVVYKVYAQIVQEYMDFAGITSEKDLPKYFVTSHDIDYKDRIEFQGLIQTFVDNAISSTVNLPNSATVDDIEHLYMLAWENGLKGVTVYRDGCMREGILTLDESKEEVVVGFQESDDYPDVSGGDCST